MPFDIKFNLIETYSNSMFSFYEYFRYCLELLKTDFDLIVSEERRAIAENMGEYNDSAGNGLSRVFRNPVMFVMQHFLISIGPVPGVDLLFAWSVMSAERKIATPIY